MSIAVIDEATYIDLYHNCVVKHLSFGLDLPAARAMAADEMSRAFTTFTTEAEEDLEHDRRNTDR